MTIRVLCFGVVKEILAADCVTVDAPEGATVQEMLHRFAQESPALAKLSASLAVAVNQQYASRDQVLHDGDELALLPPVSGGLAEFSATIALVRAPIVAADALRTLASGADGAVCSFEGVVRNHSRGRTTQYLEYEAYEEMALKQMRDLARRAQADFDIHGVVLLHRLGRLHVGETSVLIGVAAPHRDAAFHACRWLIDTLKQTVPIWKKEHFADGAEWAAGEPFPDAVLR
jgi:molybdopterin converting factor subunit 1